MPNTYTVAQYVADIRAIRATGSATAETSFYTPIQNLFNAVGQTLKPRVLFSSQLPNQGAGMPDGGFFPQPNRSPRNAEPPLLQNPERGVVEIKPAGYDLETLAASAQTLRYLQQYGIVLITNLHEFRLLRLEPNNQPRKLDQYKLAATPDDLWYRPLDPKHNQLLPDFLRRVMLYKVPLSQPKDVAWLLASYAREARARAEDHDLPAFHSVKAALEESLGIQFEGEKGEHFFRSTLVQTLFYGIFSAWVFWRHSPEGRQPNGVAKIRDWTAFERDRLRTLAAAHSLTLEAALAILGESCLDIHLNSAAFWSAVPANVWSYTLGGYQVLKKWLSYRELPLLQRPLHPEEAAWFSQIVRRITAILLLGPELDSSYQAILPTATGLPS